MNSPSRQCDFDPFEFPLTQFLYEVATPPWTPGTATVTPAVLDPTQGSGVSGETWPLVHWSSEADVDAAEAPTAPAARNAPDDAMTPPASWTRIPVTPMTRRCRRAR